MEQLITVYRQFRDSFSGLLLLISPNFPTGSVKENRLFGPSAFRPSTPAEPFSRNNPWNIIYNIICRPPHSWAGSPADQPMDMQHTYAQIQRQKPIAGIPPTQFVFSGVRTIRIAKGYLTCYNGNADLTKAQIFRCFSQPMDAVTSRHPFLFIKNLKH